MGGWPYYSCRRGRYSHFLLPFPVFQFVARRYPPPSVWLADDSHNHLADGLPTPFTSPNALQSGLPSHSGFTDSLPSLSVLILFCRCVYSCEPRDHRNKYLLLLSVNEDCQYGGSGRRRKSIKAHSLSLKATRVRFQSSN